MDGQVSEAYLQAMRTLQAKFSQLRTDHNQLSQAHDSALFQIERLKSMLRKPTILSQSNSMAHSKSIMQMQTEGVRAQNVRLQTVLAKLKAETKAKLASKDDEINRLRMRREDSPFRELGSNESWSSSQCHSLEEQIRVLRLQLNNVRTGRQTEIKASQEQMSGLKDQLERLRMKLQRKKQNLSELFDTSKKYISKVEDSKVTKIRL